MSLTTEAVRVGSADDAVRTAVTALIGSLNAPAAEVRIAAARALEYVASSPGPARVIDFEVIFGALSGMLGDRQTAVHVAVLNALGSTACKVAHAPPDVLAANLVDESPDVRAAAFKSLSCFQVGLAIGGCRGSSRPRAESRSRAARKAGERLDSGSAADVLRALSPPHAVGRGSQQTLSGG